MSFAETPGERFRKAIKEIEASCAKRKLERNEVCGAITKLKPADPLATPEGRLAHSIKIPNPVPEDSGYKPGMTPEEYFDHLCRTEAGEFIFRTVENVEGIYQMRPREEVRDEAHRHLFAMEDLYGYSRIETSDPENQYVAPRKYQYFETSRTDRPEPDWAKRYKHPSYFSKPDSAAKYARLFGYNGRDPKTMIKEYATIRRSRYGYTWRGITNPVARELGIVGGELIILELQTNEVLAVRRGFMRGDLEPPYSGIVWKRPCPLKDEGQFIFKVVKPAMIDPPAKGDRDATR
ncbi:MAG: hypothetical protein ACREJU_13845 [Nitrospiraceae bacterium]